MSDHPAEEPESVDSPSFSNVSSPSLDVPSVDTPPDPTNPRLTAPRTVSDMNMSSAMSNMTASSTPRGTLDAARRPPGANVPARNAPTAIHGDIAARMKAFSMSRAGPAAPLPNRGPVTPAVSSPGPSVPGFPSNIRLPPHMQRPTAQTANSSPAVPGVQPSRPMSMAERRGMKLPGDLPGQAPTPGTAAPPGRQKPKMTLSGMGGGLPNGGANGAEAPKKELTQMEKYAEFVDPKSGALNFKGKARVHGGGIDFTSGKSFSISLDEVDTLDELGKGNYGTVYKVRHARPKFRRTGQGLAGNKARGPQAVEEEPTPASPTRPDALTTPTSATTAQAHGRGGTTGLVMAMKEMRLELDDAKFASIIMELDVLHRCISPYIVDFYGAFFQEGAVYICMEFMDGGSIDKIYGDGIPEGVLRKITYCAALGLKSLKEEHNIIHRDVKPTNILMNSRGQIKICDFGVSGNLVASIAKTNIGCQSYMAPERISSGGSAAGGAAGVGTYSVQSDIWSLGLTIIECALGRYPYPPETYDNIFSQLSAIVDGDPPDLPAETFSPAARDFVAGCLNKIPNLRPTYPMLLQHAWLAPLVKPDTIAEEDEEAAERGEEALPTEGEKEDADGFVDREVGEWVIAALERRRNGTMGKAAKPALHAAPLDAVGGSGGPEPKRNAGAVAV